MPDSLPANGLVIVAKRDCPTCVLVEPVMQSLDRAGPLTVLSQDDPTFPSGVRTVIDDQALERSFKLNIESVPTLIRVKDGREVERVVGWERKEWMRLAGVDHIQPAVGHHHRVIRVLPDGGAGLAEWSERAAGINRNQTNARHDSPNENRISGDGASAKYFAAKTFSC